MSSSGHPASLRWLVLHRLNVPDDVSSTLGFALLGGSGEVASPRVPRWARIELALGLELHVRDDASARVLELASRLRELCASGERIS